MKTLKDKKIYVISRDTYVFEYKDVKDHIKAFEDWLFLCKNQGYIPSIKDINLRFKEIFGEWKNE